MHINTIFRNLRSPFIIKVFFLLLGLMVSKSGFSTDKLHTDKNNFCHDIDKRNARSNFESRQFPKNNAGYVKAFLIQNCDNLKKHKCSLMEGPVIESPYSKHLVFFQHFNGTAIFRAELKVNLNAEGAVTSVFDNTVAFKNISGTTFPDSIRLRMRLITLHKNAIINTEVLYFPEGDHLIPALRATVYEAATGGFNEFIFDNQENLIYHHDLNYHYTSNPDTVVKARVFLPDPLTTAHVIYGAPYAGYLNSASPYRNHNDSDVVELNAQRFLVDVHASLDKDTFRLANKYAIITEFGAPEVPPVYSKTPDFSFTRAQNGFEDVNAFFHINAMHKHLLDLGFSNVANSQIQVDCHVFGDNSNFTYATIPPRLAFGIGGVPDAQDADVIVHEYSHFINYSIAPGSNSGAERMTIDEGNCDYLAASYSRVLDDFQWQNVFNWDGHNEFWKGRVVQTSKKYTPDLSYSSIYANADIWSSSLMQIWEQIGRNATDKILIQSMYGYAMNMRMPDAAKLFLHADSLLYAGSHSSIITNTFTARGIFGIAKKIVPDTTIVKPEPELGLVNTKAFAEDEGPIVIRGGALAGLTLKIFTISGALLFEEFYPPGNARIFDKFLKPGLYIFQIKTDEKTICYKIAKF